MQNVWSRTCHCHSVYFVAVMSSEQLVLGGGGGGGGGVSAGAGAVGEPAGAAGSRDEALEIERLKELLLVHLDMITQQQDLIMARDRQIKALKSEKEAVSIQNKHFRRFHTRTRCVWTSVCVLSHRAHMCTCM